MSQLLSLPIARATNSNNAALSGAKLYFYRTGTTTPVSVYTTSALSVAHANPVVADSGGLFAAIFLDPAVTYRAILKTSADVTIADFDPVNSLAELSVRDYGAVGDNSTDNTSALANAVAGAVALGARLRIPAGTYRYATSPNWANEALQVICEPGVVLYHTGTGVAFNLDGGAAGGGIHRFRLEGQPTIRGNANTTYGIDLRACHHVHIEANIRDVATAVFRSRWMVCGELWLRASTLAIGGFSPVPVSGIVLDERGSGEQTSACTFHNPIIEGVSGYGLVLTSAVMNTFVGGTSETNGGGITLGANATQNTIINLDMEANSGVDLACSGSRNTFIGCLADDNATVGGDSNVFIGGIFDDITVDASGDGNQFIGVAYSSAAGAFTDNGTKTGKLKVRNQTTSNFDNDSFLLPSAAWLSDPAGNQRLYFDPANTNYYKATSNHIFRDATDAALLTIDSGGIKLLSGDAIQINSQQVVGGRGAALPADATDLATALTLVNAIKARLKATGGHGLVAD